MIMLPRLVLRILVFTWPPHRPRLVTLAATGRVSSARWRVANSTVAVAPPDECCGLEVEQYLALLGSKAQ